ncbi:MAG TPA: hypothetical protein VM695_07635 [Phycisphaerae bacterium]|nr:hypothetical protein [Phycisphaerae bacterium]
MRDEVLNILKAAAGRLRAVRAAESAAVGATAAGLAAAVCEAAWLVAPARPWAAVALCLVAGAGGVLLPAWRAFRRRASLSRAEGRLVAAVAASAVAAGLAGVVTGASDSLGGFVLPLLLVPCGALAGAAVVAAGGVTPLEAAIYHDVHLRLAERLSTAAEIAAAGGERPLAEHVYAQALDAARAVRPERRVPWRRTRATAGALGLSVALWGALGLVPKPAVVAVRANFERIQAHAEKITPLERKEVLRTLRRLAEAVRDNPRLLAALKAAAIAAEADKHLPERLREFGDVLADADDARAAAIARSLLAAMGLPTDAEAPGGADQGAGGRLASADANKPVAADANGLIGQAGQKPLAARVHVWDPQYRDVRDANLAPSTAPAAGAAALVPLANAWTAAQDEARQALTAGRVPPEYRRLVRRFFEIE